MGPTGTDAVQMQFFSDAAVAVGTAHSGEFIVLY